MPMHLLRNLKRISNDTHGYIRLPAARVGRGIG